MTPKLLARLKELRDGKGQFNGEVYYIFDGYDEIVCLFVPAEYDFARETFEHAAGSAMQAGESADWSRVRHPVLVTMRDETYSRRRQ